MKIFGLREEPQKSCKIPEAPPKVEIVEVEKIVEKEVEKIVEVKDPREKEWRIAATKSLEQAYKDLKYLGRTTASVYAWTAIQRLDRELERLSISHSPSESKDI